MKYIVACGLILLTTAVRGQQYNRETNNTVRYTDSTAQVEIWSIHKMLLNGYDFPGLAVRYSQDPGSYKVGGDLGLSTMNDYVPEYKKVAQALALNEISRPFKTDFGYHIVQLIARKDSLYHTRHILLRTD